MRRVYVNESACIACRLCEVHCRLKHSPIKDQIKAFQKQSLPQPLLRVEKSSPVSFSVPCRHCAEPSCVYACLTSALHREPGGIVMVDEEKCIGCWTCILACSFGVIRQEKSRRKISKCDLCFGDEVPACVANCPNEALVYAEASEPVPG